MKILLAADGSEYTRIAARQLVQQLPWFAAAPEIHVVHIRPPIPLASAAATVGRAVIEKYEREESQLALAVAERELNAAHVAYRACWCLGDVAPELALYARKNHIDLVVMGSHGHGALANLALGSVVTKCLVLMEAPILVVRRGKHHRAHAAVQTATSAAKVMSAPEMATP